jgi:hypothetical protein
LALVIDKRGSATTLQLMTTTTTTSAHPIDTPLYWFTDQFTCTLFFVLFSTTASDLVHPLKLNPWRQTLRLSCPHSGQPRTFKRGVVAKSETPLMMESQEWLCS